MSEIKSSIELLLADLRDYADTRMALMKLKAAEKSSALAGRFIAGLALAVSLILFFSFVSIGLAMLLGQWLGKPWLGFIILGFVYLLMGLLVWKARRKLIQQPVMNGIIQELFEEIPNEKDQDIPATES